MVVSYSFDRIKERLKQRRPFFIPLKLSLFYDLCGKNCYGVRPVISDLIRCERESNAE